MGWTQPLQFNMMNLQSDYGGTAFDGKTREATEAPWDSILGSKSAELRVVNGSSKMTER